jgi:hypothetical protein
MVAGEGFEPSQTESESVVLPLHNPASIRQQYVLYPSFRHLSIGFCGYAEGNLRIYFNSQHLFATSLKYCRNHGADSRTAHNQHATIAQISAITQNIFSHHKLLSDKNKTARSGWMWTRLKKQAKEKGKTRAEDHRCGDGDKPS